MHYSLCVGYRAAWIGCKSLHKLLTIEKIYAEPYIVDSQRVSCVGLELGGVSFFKSSSHVFGLLSDMLPNVNHNYYKREDVRDVMPRRTYARYQRNDSRTRKHTKRWKVKRNVVSRAWLGTLFAEIYTQRETQT